jgi:hypothetical protein
MSLVLASPSTPPRERRTELPESLDTQLLQAIMDSGRNAGRVTRLFPAIARGASQVERLLYLRHQAQLAEADGKHAAAEFLWTEAHRAVVRRLKRPQPWRLFVERLPQAPDAPARGDLDRLLRCFIGVAFVDSHLSWYEAWRSVSSVRAWTHLEHARQMIDLAAFTTEEKHLRIGPRTVAEIQWRLTQKEPVPALRLATELSRRFPESSEYLDLLCEARVAATVARLRPGNKRRDRRRNAHVLALGLYELKRLRLDRPHHLCVFRAISRLHTLRAETLESEGLLAEALVDAESSATYAPDPAAIELRTRLEAAMQALRVEVALPESERPVLKAKQAKARLRQAAKGFRLVDSFRKSDEARSVVEDLPVAMGRAVWERIGLPTLEAVDHRPLALEDAIQTVLSAPPPDRSGVRLEWQRVSQDNPHLRELDSAQVCAYIAQRLFGGDFQPPPDVQPHRVPVVRLNVSSPVKSSEPFFLWLFSGRHKRVKLQLVMATTLATAAVVLAVSEVTARTARTQAYSQLLEARAAGRFESMLDSADRFMSQRVIGRDDRIRDVEALYSEALVRWFNSSAPDPAEAERRIARYREKLLANK